MLQGGVSGNFLSISSLKNRNKKKDIYIKPSLLQRIKRIRELLPKQNTRKKKNRKENEGKKGNK